MKKKITILLTFFCLFFFGEIFADEFYKEFHNEVPPRLSDGGVLDWSKYKGPEWAKSASNYFYVPNLVSRSEGNLNFTCNDFYAYIYAKDCNVQVYENADSIKFLSGNYTNGKDMAHCYFQFDPITQKYKISYLSSTYSVQGVTMKKEQKVKLNGQDVIYNQAAVFYGNFLDISDKNNIILKGEELPPELTQGSAQEILTNRILGTVGFLIPLLILLAGFFASLHILKKLLLAFSNI